MTNEGPPMAGQAITIMLVDDHPLWRSALREIIEQKQLGSIVAEVADGCEVASVAADARPDVVLMDMGLPGLDGAQATADLVDALPDAKVLVVSASDRDQDVLEAMRAGARGYLLKTAGNAEIVDAVRRVCAGEIVLPPSLVGPVLGDLRRGRDDSSRPARRAIDEVSPREREVLELMAEGRSNQAIAHALSLNAKTVEAHIRSIFTKLGLEPAVDDHRRVLAVLAYLESS